MTEIKLPKLSEEELDKILNEKPKKIKSDCSICSTDKVMNVKKDEY
ncbi:hypothetical protein BMS3Abin17_00101 [archaeon BMS3Abin17]|nr:hypothetical protein BMS3Abin17_00101 [archaeon BMS3Abin17]